MSYRVCVFFSFKFLYNTFTDSLCSNSLFTNSNWFAFEDEKISNEQPAESLVAQSLDTQTIGLDNSIQAISTEHVQTIDTLSPSEADTNLETAKPQNESSILEETKLSDADKSSEWVEWRETLGTDDSPNVETEVSSTSKNLETEPSTEHSVAKINIPETSSSPPATLECVLNVDNELQNQLDNLAGQDEDHK